jgi:tellurite methyltransferase
MVESDRERWDRKFAAGEGPAHFRPKAFLCQHAHLLSMGRALDVACGFGGNALYLALLGYQVDAIDVSGVALAQAQTEAKRRGLRLNLVQADLTRWWVPPRRYDAILVFFYLNRELMPRLAEGLRPGGLLFQANRNTRYLAIRPSYDRNYLLLPSELRRLALDAGLEVVHYGEEPPGENYNTQLVARRPG